MAPGSRRRPAPRRRRNDDEGEDETSVAGDIDDDSLSEGSALTDDVEGDATDEEEILEVTKSAPKQDAVKSSSPVIRGEVDEAAKSAPKFPASADTTAMMNGLKISDETANSTELHFDETTVSQTEPEANTQAPEAAPVAPKKESEAQRARREHQEYLKQRDANPAFVPNRGGFFLHDDRSSGVPAWNRGFGRGRGRGFSGTMTNGRGGPMPEPLARQWAHDLHETHEPAVQIRNNAQNEPTKFRPAVASRDSAPNREFSFSNVLGNVMVNVALPGTDQRKAVPGLVKKQHVLLPIHRPPLRRDKPVRISIPEVEPSYRFPSTERSFIFIPRAMRPNQQPYSRGRGRGSYQGSRRPSVLGGSVYTPSVAMSRRSSLGAGRDTRSPAGSAYGRSTFMNEQPRPVVRMPVSGPMPVAIPPPMVGIPGNGAPYQTPFMNGSVQHGVHSTAIPMHQPKPQKAVSITNIESPASLAVKAPPQQQQQPFHQQMPAYVGHSAPDDAAPMVAQTAGTPLSHIPEGAVYAQPFQPYPMMAAPMYYPGPYGNGAVYYPAMPDPMHGFNPQWAEGVYQNANLNQRQMANATAHFGNNLNPTMNEQNGMVYYSDPAMAQHGQGPVGGQPVMPMAMGGYGFYPAAPSFYQAQP